MDEVVSTFCSCPAQQIHAVVGKHLDLIAVRARPVPIKQGEGVLEKGCAASNRIQFRNIVSKKVVMGSAGRVA